jgi:hypothetical protein
MLMRHGVRLSPRLADLFDVIDHAGDRGVQCEVLADVFWPGKSRQRALDCVRVNIFHLNDKLSETDYEIRAGTNNYKQPYRVQKRLDPVAEGKQL